MISGRRPAAPRAVTAGRRGRATSHYQPCHRVLRPSAAWATCSATPGSPPPTSNRTCRSTPWTAPAATGCSPRPPAARLSTARSSRRSWTSSARGDTLVVWKLDRLGRSLRHLVDTVTGLAGRGVAFRSLQEQVDTTTPGGRLVFHVFAALAEFERTWSGSGPVRGLPPRAPATAAAAGRRCCPGTSCRWHGRCTRPGATRWRRSPRPSA
jgi:hypothetical protein